LLKHFKDTRRHKFLSEYIVNNMAYLLQDMKVKKEVLGLISTSDLCVKFQYETFVTPEFETTVTSLYGFRRMSRDQH
jgi:hypothetical protein